MPSADGFIKSTAGGRFAATFVIDEIMFNFSGSFASSVPAFTCNTATLNYPSLKSISSTRSFEGRVGPSKVTLNLANGPAISGVLDMPLSPGSTVSGSGVWTQN
ncbi:hypothetical protein D9619_007964 [Psilocybe cf. subviscida]|uniref:Uncharacterized protein n=1 Tax=Psilocybe cf. subviscida TaxID=2480587 RepID=A0A8H5AU13_9AGAR|nr:hypothetical protein D9619_007964 [Psilocybe cf. subviscida]